MADRKQLAFLKKGVEGWNAWRAKNPDVKIDLSRANLTKTELGAADLSKVDLRRASLDEAFLGMAFLDDADLSRADLSRAQLSGADLSGALLFESDLTGAHLDVANLSKADFRRAKLHAADLVFADLTRANFSEARFGDTIFGDIDLSIAEGLESAIHDSPSIIGIDTIYRSKGNISEVFLRGCGVPEDMIAHTRSIRGKAFDFYSCFISHSAKDKRFCELLYADLQAKGVRVWLFEEDAKWGETVWSEIDRSIKMYDKLIVVCSKNPLQSGPVNREIERALSREDKEGKGILFPIRIDDYIFDTWEHERKADVLRKVVGDFSGWDKDAAKYDKAFDKLLKGLQAGA
jgi:uncharacterized protein YjbI with pentapeptide repeats